MRTAKGALRVAALCDATVRRAVDPDGQPVTVGVTDDLAEVDLERLIFRGLPGEICAYRRRIAVRQHDDLVAELDPLNVGQLVVAVPGRLLALAVLDEGDVVDGRDGEVGADVLVGRDVGARAAVNLVVARLAPDDVVPAARGDAVVAAVLRRSCGISAAPSREIVLSLTA